MTGQLAMNLGDGWTPSPHPAIRMHGDAVTRVAKDGTLATWIAGHCLRTVQKSEAVLSDSGDALIGSRMLRSSQWIPDMFAEEMPVEFVAEIARLEATPIAWVEAVADQLGPVEAMRIIRERTK